MTDSLKGLAERRELDGRARMVRRLHRENARLRSENARLRAVVEHIAYEPLGHAEASWEEALTIATSIARATLDVGEQKEERER